MNIPALTIDQDGPGIDLSSQPEGIAIQMSDPVRDLEYALNRVTFVYDLSGYEGVRLAFEAMEYGDEPHYPKDEGGSENVENIVGFGPFADDVNFDGVAVSMDGVDWYEIQDLRSLRSDKFTAYDIDLDAAVAALGLAYGSAFRIRFCQYDDNPAPMDGFSIQGIQLQGDLRPPILHLTMNDNAATPTVVDASAGLHHQTFLDPTGDPNTNAHSVPGRVGTALSFDGTDDNIDLGATVDAALTAGQNFAVAFWWARGAGNNEDHTFSFQKTANNGQLLALNGFYVPSGQPYTQFYVYRSNAPVDRTLFPILNVGYDWNHYVFQRRGDTFELWFNGALRQQDTTVGNARDFSGTGTFLLGGWGSDHAQGTMDDFRVYDRALLGTEITALATP